jgi:hypothetical protein
MRMALLRLKKLEQKVKSQASLANQVALPAHPLRSQKLANE